MGVDSFMAMSHLKRANSFWAEMSACEHFVQIYESEEVFMDILASFVSEALKEDHTAARDRPNELRQNAQPRESS